MAAASDARVARRGEILAAASRMFARDGFHGVSIDELGAAVGLSGPALYRYFPSKEAILSAMLVDISERLLEGGRERALQQPALDALVDFHVDFALDHPDLIAVQSRDLAAMPEEDRRAVRRLQAQYVEIWVAALQAERPVLASDDARAAVHATFGLINSTPHSARLARRDGEAAPVGLGRPAMAALLRAMALAGLRSAPAR